ncbi:MAG: ABC transporter substrate-binding protein [Burkholderiaceae bacterium]
MLRRTSIRQLAATAIAAAALLAAGPAPAADPIRIGIALPLSGAAASYGHDSRQGADMAAAQINAANGVLGGRQIELVYEDDKGSPQGGVAAVQKLMNVGRVKVVTGGMNSSVVLAESSVTRNKILHVNMAAQADAITDQKSPYLFQINNTVSDNSRAFNKYLTTTLKPKTAAYMGENTEFNKTVLELLKSSLAAAGVELVNVSTYDADTNDFTSIITRIKSLDPDMLYVSDAYPSRAAQLWTQVRQVGGFRIEAMSPGVVTPGMMKPAAGAMNGVITGDIFVPGDDSPGAREFTAAFRQRYGQDPNKVSLVSYEAIRVIAAAIDKAGTDSDPAKIARTLRENAWTTPRGELRFDDKGRAHAPYFYVQKVKDEQLVLIDRSAN